MAFMGMFIIGIFIVMAISMMIFLTVAIILKIVGKKKDSPRMKLVGNIFLVLSIVLAIPVVSVTKSVIESSLFAKITFEDGTEKKVLKNKTNRLVKLASSVDEIDYKELEKLLEDEPDLIYYLDTNGEGIIDYGLENGDYELIKFALKHGAEFDSKVRYDGGIDAQNSMHFFLNERAGGEITDEHIKILKLLFDNKVSTDIKVLDKSRHSNILGSATWVVLYNDERVTDTEIEFIQVFRDNGIKEDSKLLLYEDIQDSVVNYDCEQLKKDDNYYKLIEMVGYKY